MLPQSGTFYRLIWLMPASFAAHIAEEWLGGFAGWVTHVVGGAMSDQAFIENNAFFMAVMLILTFFAAFSRTCSRSASTATILEQAYDNFGGDEPRGKVHIHHLKDGPAAIRHRAGGRRRRTIARIRKFRKPKISTRTTRRRRRLDRRAIDLFATDVH